MTEVWLRYGKADVVLEIQQDRIAASIKSSGDPLPDEQLEERLGSLELEKPFDLAILHATESVRRTVNLLFEMCAKKSVSPPKILADDQTAAMLRPFLPQGAMMAGLEEKIPDSRLVFISEMEMDGLFGYETVSTRLLRRFGQDRMLAAYSKRAGSVPAPGQKTGSATEAASFADGFEIQGIDIAASHDGIIDVGVGHPSKAPPYSKLEAAAIREAGQHKSMIISTGKEASSMTLRGALGSLWGCAAAISRGGLAILLAESRDGPGSEALRRFIDGTLEQDRLENPSEYVDGMEDLLFLSTIQKEFQIALVSVLPEFHTRKLGMVSLNGAKAVTEYISRTQGPTQKVALAYDGSRLLLR